MTDVPPKISQRLDRGRFCVTLVRGALADTLGRNVGAEASRESCFLLAINRGSSRIRFALYEEGKPLLRLLVGKVDRVGLSGTNLTFKDSTEQSQNSRTIDKLFNRDFDGCGRVTNARHAHRRRIRSRGQCVVGLGAQKES